MSKSNNPNKAIYDLHIDTSSIPGSLGEKFTIRVGVDFLTGNLLMNDTVVRMGVPTPTDDGGFAYDVEKLEHWSRLDLANGIIIGYDPEVRLDLKHTRIADTYVKLVREGIMQPREISAIVKLRY